MRRRVRDRAHHGARSAAQQERVFGSQERAISVRDSRPENELSQVGVSLSAIETIHQKRPDSVLHSERNSDPTAVCTQQISTIDT